MIAEWMLYCVIASAALALCAIVVERALLNGRASVRFVWVASIALSIGIPLATYQFARRNPPLVAIGAEAASPFIGDTTFLLATAPNTATHSRVVEQTVQRAWSAQLDQYNATLQTVWTALSLLLACGFAGSAASLTVLQRRWKARTVQGVQVLMSENAGPALVGTFWTDIVLPRWVLTLSESQQRLMLQHEIEHRRAHDSQLLMLARMALVVMPWNPVMWWSVLRLRAAVEFDCDARVLQTADAHEYGELILKVAGAKSNVPMIAATAFAERATQLERRISVLTRHRVATSRAAQLLAIAIALIVPTTAWMAPHPSVPAIAALADTGKSSTNARDVLPKPDSARIENPEQPSVEQRTSAAIPSHETVGGETLNRHVQPVANGLSATVDATPRARVASAPDSVRNAAQAGAQNYQALINAVRDSMQRVQVQRLTDTIYSILYSDVSLSAREQQSARQLIASLQVEQQQQTAAYVARRQAMQAHRDSALRALLPGGADRAVLESRLASGPGARGAAPAGANSPLTGGRGGRSGGGGTPLGGVSPGGLQGGARMGGAGNPGFNNISATDMAFRRIFDGIALTAEQEASARSILSASQTELVNTPPPSVIRINIQARSILVGAPVDSSLVAFAGSATERERIRSRIVTVPPR